MEVLDHRSWAAAVKARILDPIGMRATVAVITNDIRPRTAESWVAYYEDRPYPRFGRLAPAANLQFNNAAGSIASTPADMTLYMQMLLNHGQAPNARIVSPESFLLMSKPWIKAPDFGTDASYGYGIAVETVDGHTILRHTGGMASFMSAINMDLDAGAGAFASINAQQGYRPVPVTKCAVQLMAASAAGKPAPAAPEISDPKVVKNAADYVGTYISPDGKTIEITGDNSLAAVVQGQRIELQHTSGDHFAAADQHLSRYLFVFGRAKSEAADKPDGEKPKPGPVIELIYGSGWYTNSRYNGPNSFSAPPEYAALTGTYLGAGGFEGTQTDIFVIKGELCADGETMLERIGDCEFRPTEDAPNPERVEFHFLADGKARLMKWSGADLFRFEGE